MLESEYLKISANRYTSRPRKGFFCARTDRAAEVPHTRARVRGGGEIQ